MLTSRLVIAFVVFMTTMGSPLSAFLQDQPSTKQDAETFEEFQKSLEQKAKAADFQNLFLHLNQYIVSHPQSDAALRLRAEYFLAYGQNEAAYHDLTKAIEVAPEVADSYAARSVLSLHAGDVNGAQKDLDKALQLSPTSMLTLIARAKLHGQQGKTLEALKDFEAAIAADVKSPIAVFQRGNFYLSRELYRKAIDDFSEADRRFPGSPLFRMNRARAYSATKQYDEALADYAEAIRLDPSSSLAVFLRGILYDQMGRLEDAIVDMTECIRLEPDFSRAYGVRATLYRRMGKIDQEIQDLDSCIALDPTDTIALRARAGRYIVASEPVPAIELLNAVIQLQPEARDFRSRFIAWRMQGNYSNALKDIDIYLKAVPKDLVTYKYRAAIYMAQHDKRATVDFLKLANASWLRQDSDAILVAYAYYAAKLSNENELARKILDDNRGRQSGTHWAVSALKYADGKLPQEDLLKHASESIPVSETDKPLADAYLILGLQAIITNENELAKSHLEQFTANSDEFHSLHPVFVEESKRLNNATTPPQ